MTDRVNSASGVESQPGTAPPPPPPPSSSSSSSPPPPPPWLANLAAARSEHSSGYASSNSSASSSSPNSPPSYSPPHTLKRSKSSSFRLINRRISTQSNCSEISLPRESTDRLTLLIGWYPAFLLKIYFELLTLFAVVCLKHLPLMVPTLWASACLWLFFKVIKFPFFLARYVLMRVFLPTRLRMRAHSRTILVSGGSTVQCVYVARNFYSAGARVVCCDVAGKFQLARFSACVARYYTLPAPDDERGGAGTAAYIAALKRVVTRERCELFVPVSETSAAYYDALAKAHLEPMGCACWCPNADDVLLLDDVAEVLRLAQRCGLPTPPYYEVRAAHELGRLYDAGVPRQLPHTMLSCGPVGCRERVAYALPAERRDYRLRRPVSDAHPWAVVPRLGERYSTCTTVRDTRVLCNVTCAIGELGQLVPVDRPDIERWLERFFDALRATRRHVVGHVGLQFGRHPATGELVPIDCRVGVGLPYICYTSVQSRIVCKPCRHFQRANSGPVVDAGGKYWLDRVVLEAVTHLSPAGLWNLLGVLCCGERRDALFVLWDPLPYCAYYYLQVPLNKFCELWRRRSSADDC